LKKNDKPTKNRLSKDDYKKAYRIFRFIKPYGFYFAASFLFMLLSSATTMLIPYLFGQLFSLSDPSSAAEPSFFSSTKSVMAVIFIVFATQSIFSFFRIYFSSLLTENTLFDIRQSVFNKLIYSPIQFFNTHKVGEISSRIATDINLLQDTFNTTIAEFVRQFIIILIGLAALFYFSPELSLIMLGIVPLVAIIGVFFGRFIKGLSKEAQNQAANSNVVIEESLSGIAVVKAFTNEWLEINRYAFATEKVKQLSIRGAVWKGVFVSFIIFSMFGAIVFIIWRGLTLLPTGELMSFILYTVFLAGSIGSMPELWAKIQKAIGATENLMELLDNDTELVGDESADVRFKGKIEFKDVHFSYPNRKDIDVLKGVSFNVEAGKTVALVGASGAGKSTITALLLQFYKPDMGAIYFDNKPAEQYDLKTIRSQMAIVPQDVFLFGGSIRENIAYGKPGASDEAIIEAAKNANAWEFIERFPDGINTLVGDRGVQLSGGQKQRIAIARALLNDPAILILDEATSSLDAVSEQLVQQGLEKLMEGRTSIVIAHRLATVKNVDEIFVLEHGLIKEKGTHEQLIAQLGLYEKLSRLQLTH
jgi:ABC-type multidrug transport system fused ATPase/permease subunit